VGRRGLRVGNPICWKYLTLFNLTIEGHYVQSLFKRAYYQTKIKIHKKDAVKMQTEDAVLRNLLVERTIDEAQEYYINTEIYTLQICMIG